MSSFELTILGQHLLLNVPEGKEQYYQDIANELSDMMTVACYKQAPFCAALGFRIQVRPAHHNMHHDN